MKTSDFDYNLPENKIAKYPLPQRDHSKLLVYDHGKIIDDIFYNIHKYLEAGTTLITNNSKVIPARLIFYKPTGAKIEIFCLEPYDNKDFAQVFASRQKVEWKAIVGNAKKWKTSTLQKQINTPKDNFLLIATKEKSLENGTYIVSFEWNAPYSFAEVVEFAGKVPIPPYLKRDTEDIDKKRYQTVYAKIEGSVAAPTAGLHFTNNVLTKLLEKNIHILETTLHVSAGTFKPIDTEDVTQHKMHKEWIVLQKSFIEKLLNTDSRIAVGTTSLRSLESIYWAGIAAYNNYEIKVTQDMPYTYVATLTYKQALEELLNYMHKRNINNFSFPTEIMIMPGYRVKSIKALITNFHQPKSTLLVLIASLIDDDWEKVYDYALSHDYRFLSYGDSSLLKF